jgi:hypothetical protein
MPEQQRFQRVAGNDEFGADTGSACAATPFAEGLEGRRIVNSGGPFGGGEPLE